ncbi:MAG: COP23 domain-containing protein [Hormoscilla sp.]
MKNKSWKTAIAAAAIMALGTACQQRRPTPTQPTASTTPTATYYCDRSADGTPTTFVKTARGKIPLIRWESDDFASAGYPRQKRCEIVSEKFQSYLEQGILNYITTGRDNDERVICVSKEEGGRCHGTLWTLKKDDDADELIDRLLQLSYASGVPFAQNSDGYSQVYIEIDNILRNAPIEK